MSVSYQAIQWNAHKKRYDILIAAAVLTYLAVFVGVGMTVVNQPPDPMTLLIRATGTAAVALLHVILAIGPLSRLDARFSPFLYNRRHLGVSFFLIALIHAGLTMLWYGSFGQGFPLLNLIAGYSGLTPDSFPFEVLGFAALCIFFLMAATSHDFWLANLGPRWWKTLHVLVYLAYLLVIGHVALGAVRAEPNGMLAPLLGLGALALSVLHVAAGIKPSAETGSINDGWVDAGAAESIPDKRARVIQLPGGRRAAVFRDGDAISAISNVCAHQGGPLGEGEIIDGCVTCPWHGYQYNAADGCSPPPFTEKIPTYEVRVRGGRVELRSEANDPGTAVQPAVIDPEQGDPS